MAGFNRSGNVRGIARFQVHMQSGFGVDEVDGRNESYGNVHLGDDAAGLVDVDGEDVVVAVGTHGGGRRQVDAA